MEWTRPRPPPQLAYSLPAQQWYDYEQDDEKSQESLSKADREGAIHSLLPSRSASSLQTDFANPPSHEGMGFQSLGLLSMPQLEEDATEFQPFCGPPNPSFLDYTSLPLPQFQQEQPLRSLQPFDDQMSPPFGLQFADFASDRGTDYLRALPPYSTPGPSSQPIMRSSVDYLTDSKDVGFSTLNSVPSLPTTFSMLEQQQHRLLPVQTETFGEHMAPSTASTLFRPSLIATETLTSAELTSSLTMHSLPSTSVLAHPSASMELQAPDCSPVAIPRREHGLREPFTTLAITEEPKFSPDKRKLCCVEGCVSQARAFNRCKRHGGSKRCSSPGCTKSVQSRGLCIRHGGGSRCQESGCTRASQSQGRCKLHGGGRPCIVKGCEKKAHLKRLCRKHGGGTKCCVPNCDKWSQRQGMCMTHSKVAGPSASGDAAPYEVKAMASPLSLSMFTDAV